MMKGGAFGAYFKARRLALGKTLRAFCLEHGFDPGNTSRLERGRMAVPQSRKVLDRYARALKLKRGSQARQDFFDLASAEGGRIPPDLLSDAEVVKRLPVIFRGLRGRPIAEEELKALIDLVRRS